MLYYLALWSLIVSILIMKRLPGMEQQHSNRVVDDDDDAGCVMIITKQRNSGRC
jgi:hypothetical protein